MRVEGDDGAVAFAGALAKRGSGGCPETSDNEEEERQKEEG